MPNKYKYDLTFNDKHLEEDREVINDLYREEHAYLRTLNNINTIFLKTLQNMSQSEIKEILKSRYTFPAHAPFMTEPRYSREYEEEELE